MRRVAFRQVPSRRDSDASAVRRPCVTIRQACGAMRLNASRCDCGTSRSVAMRFWCVAMRMIRNRLILSSSQLIFTKKELCLFQFCSIRSPFLSIVHSHSDQCYFAKIWSCQCVSMRRDAKSRNQSYFSHPDARPTIFLTNHGSPDNPHMPTMFSSTYVYY